MDFSEYIGMPLGSGTLVVERGPLTQFAQAIHDANPVYRNAEVASAAGFDGIPAPPTYGFIAQNWGRWEERQTGDGEPARNPMAEVMGGLLANGGLILHGEQTFTYHRPLVSGEVLSYEGKVADLYQKPTGDRTMTFLVTETTYTDADGEPVLTSVMNLIHRS
ncbi:MAG TPA: MaoC family dehydratase N-terminal domain-containing protein [Microthrixaceae bacterium]|nr:MaoC family dehydratase N-terminal domain-containing protein [Microthrixaceae bacterium]